MNKLHTILVFGAIFAAGLGAVSVNDQAISAFITPTVLESNSQGISLLGHVEFVVHDSEGNIVKYAQSDNLITTTGGDCIAAELFLGSSVGVCGALGTWDFIAIGNATTSDSVVGDDRMDEDSGEDGLAAVGSVHTGEMARKQVTPSFNTGGANTIVTLTTATPFTFSGTLNNGNATIVTQSALFSEGATISTTTGETTVLGTTEMLAVQNLPSSISVTDGDSLTVTWTITIATG